MAISVNEYMNDNTLLKVYYVPYSYKLDLVDTILENLIDRDTTPATVNLSMLKNISDHLFIQRITNLDLSQEANDGADGYDLLCQYNLLNGLLDSILIEYQRFKEILNDRLNDFFRYEYSQAKAIYDVANSIATLLSTSADYVETAIKNIDIDKIVKMIPNNQLPKSGD